MKIELEKTVYNEPNKTKYIYPLYINIVILL